MTEADIRRIFAKPPKGVRLPRRNGLTATQRKAVLAKTGGICHVCGCAAGERWQADHVVPHERGGTHTLENYLPICRACNRLRWSYGPEVLRLMLRFGILAKQEIRHDTKLGRLLLHKALRQHASSRKQRTVLPTLT